MARSISPPAVPGPSKQRSDQTRQVPAGRAPESRLRPSLVIDSTSSRAGSSAPTSRVQRKASTPASDTLAKFSIHLPRERARGSSEASGSASTTKDVRRVQQALRPVRSELHRRADGDKDETHSRDKPVRLVPAFGAATPSSRASRLDGTDNENDNDQNGDDDAERGGTDRDDDDTSEGSAVRSARPSRSQRRVVKSGSFYKGKARADSDELGMDTTRRAPRGRGQQEDSDEEEDELIEDDSSAAAEGASDSSASPPSSAAAESTDEEESASAESDADDENGLRRRRSKRAATGESSAHAGKRRSTHEATRKEKRYDFGDGRFATTTKEEERQQADVRGGDDEDGGSARSSRSSPPTRSTRATRAAAGATRDQRAPTSTTTSIPRSRTSLRGSVIQVDDSSDGSKGESSDELGMHSRAKRGGHRPAAIADSEDEEDEVDELASSSGHGEPEEDRPQDLHRETCAKCGYEAASVLLDRLQERRNRKKKKPGRGRKRDDFDEDTDAEEDRVEKYGAWVECGVCCQSYHFGCLPATQKRELVDSPKSEHLARHADPTSAGGPPLLPGSVVPTPAGSGSATPMPANVPPRPKHELDTNRTFALTKCPLCKKAGGRKCFVCGLSGKRITAREAEELGEERADAELRDEEKASGAGEPANAVAHAGQTAGEALKPGLMFRCSKCKRVAHYGCLENDEPGWTFEQHTQSYFDWAICHDCYNYNQPLDVILAWAEADPLPEGCGDDVEPDDEPVEQVVGETRVDPVTQKVVVVPSAKDLRANAKYLVKWQEMSYRQLQWVPHAFLAATYPAKLSNFLARGSLVKFETAKDDDPEDADPADTGDKDAGEVPLPDPGAMERIPDAWRTVDRILNVWYKHPRTGAETEFANFAKCLPEDPSESIKLVAQCYIKWCDLAYAEGTIEAPPEPDEPGYDAYVSAYKNFLVACGPRMRVPSLTKKQMDDLDKPRDPKRFVELEKQPDYIAGHRLHDFQLAGINFLRNRWWLRKGCILADEMGLGKTCQVITFLTYLNKKEGARPFLVIVPNSLIGNWMREFALWAPSMRVVPYHGDTESRRIVEDYELFDSRGALKTHVVLATYEAVAGNARVFRKVDRWDCLVVDEGQRLKAGPESQLYTAIASLRVAQRVLLTGTPLNNNIKELFNLLAFINPDEYDNIDALVQEYAELTPERVDKIRGMLKPYFLRRTKETSLDLPPLIEVVVPVSMTVLQRGLYRSILERNAAAIRSIVQSSGAPKSRSGKGKKAGSFVNILMELRKSLCHPYLVSADMEPVVASAQEAHRNLTDASAKFVLLERMLPKLKAAGHRVLIFSQFKITLNIIERFLAGLELKYLRLDGDTPQIERQRGVDKYNAPGSEYFAYLLSTRAGGVGLNITSADVVIIYDQDFNPQMDLQAISRAHRMGQTKPVRVFKLVVKSTCEEKILNAGSKKRGLEHLIIQRIDAKDESEDMESMLQFGAKAVFDDQAAEVSAIRYSDADIDDLLAKTADPAAKESDSAATFAQAQIWVREKGEGDAAGLAVAVDEGAPGDTEDGDSEDLHDFWSKVVEQQQEAEKASKAAQAATVGRGKRKRAPVNYKVEAPRASTKVQDDASKSPLSGLSDLSSDDEYRHTDDSEGEAVGPQPHDAKPPHLAANGLQQGTPVTQIGDPATRLAGDNYAPVRKRRKKQTDPHDRADRRRQKILSLSHQAGQVGCVRAKALFETALLAESRTQQSNRFSRSFAYKVTLAH